MTYKAPTGEYITLACHNSDDEKSVLHYQNCKQKTSKNNKNSSPLVQKCSRTFKMCQVGSKYRYFQRIYLVSILFYSLVAVNQFMVTLLMFFGLVRSGNQLIH